MEKFDLLEIPLLGIRIRNRIRMFLGILEPDPLVKGMGPAPDPDPNLIYIGVEPR